MAQAFNLNSWTCPIPLRDHPNIVMGHGGGGKLSAELVEHLFLPAFQNDALATLGDSSVLEIGDQRLAFSTDSYVVQPLFFPDGNIGDLAVNGTVNDLAMSGAQPLYLSTGFILEEGVSLEMVAAVAQAMGEAAQRAGVTLATGDTKVVDKGHGDGIYINTSGLGIVPSGVEIGPHCACPGDVVIVSGEIGLHSMAIMSVREGLTFDSAIESDTAPLHDLVAAMLDSTPEINVLRDPTRGGVASTLNEIAQSSQVSIVINERSLPVSSSVHSACEILGMDPLYVANEGKLIAIVPAPVADDLLAQMQQHPLGVESTIIGEVTDQHPGMVVAKTGIGGTRVVDMLIGEQLPRIC
ncbi:hydrogenase expression/formation protein HypE [Chloroflexi bacterium TSY]|nr:hydrogenase expression/formation protein HypE [Chloroflexi bacterium TSY]